MQVRRIADSRTQRLAQLGYVMYVRTVHCSMQLISDLQGQFFGYCLQAKHLTDSIAIIFEEQIMMYDLLDIFRYVCCCVPYSELKKNKTGSKAGQSRDYRCPDVGNGFLDRDSYPFLELNDMRSPFRPMLPSWKGRFKAGNKRVAAGQGKKKGKGGKGKNQGVVVDDGGGGEGVLIGPPGPGSRKEGDPCKVMCMGYQLDGKVTTRCEPVRITQKDHSERCHCQALQKALCKANSFQKNFDSPNPAFINHLVGLCPGASNPHTDCIKCRTRGSHPLGTVGSIYAPGNAPTGPAMIPGPQPLQPGMNGPGIMPPGQPMMMPTPVTSMMPQFIPVICAPPQVDPGSAQSQFPGLSAATSPSAPTKQQTFGAKEKKGANVVTGVQQGVVRPQPYGFYSYAAGADAEAQEGQSIMEERESTVSSPQRLPVMNWINGGILIPTAVDPEDFLYPIMSLKPRCCSRKRRSCHRPERHYRCRIRGRRRNSCC